MNCQQFTSFIVEVARGQMMDAASRDGATRHAESCEACAARLAQEQSLTNALRAVALDLKDVSAPARLEAKLLTAFHESLAQRNATAAAADASPLSTPVSLPTAAMSAYLKPRTSRHTRRIAYAATFALAASLVLVVLAALYLRLALNTSPAPRDPAANDSRAARKASPPADKELTVATSLSPLAPTIRHSVQPSTRPSDELSVEPSLEVETLPESATPPDVQRGGESLRAAIKRAPRQRHAPTMIRAQHVIDGGNAIIEASAEETATAKSNEAESVTEFISLVADAPAAPPLESGQLVRVQVPRAALASLGLPLNAERGNEPVKADVLLGGDGLARAIRFVR